MVSGGHAFSIQIDLDGTVEQMKWLILLENPEFGRYGTSSFTVFLAKDSNGNWLKSADDSVFSVADERIADAIKSATAQRPLEGDERLSSSTCFGADFVPHADNIYVLVVPATPNKRRRVEDDSSVGALRLAASGCSRTVKIWCAMVGEGGQFPIKIDLDATVEEMKELILVKNLEFARFGTRALTVFLAKDSNGNWYKWTDEDILAVMNQRIPGAIKAAMSQDPLTDSDILSSVACFGADFVPDEDDFHVLVRLPSVGLRQQDQERRDSTGAWQGAHCVAFLELPRFPSLDELSVFTALELPAKIRVPEYEYNLIMHETNVEIRDKMFECDGQAPCHTLWSRVISRVLDPVNGGGTEFNYIHLWDSLIRVPISTVFQDLGGYIDRNTCKGASTGMKRPDMVFRLNDVCVFRGEEKSGSTVEVPRRELSEKLQWSYGDAPYVFGYAAAGFQCALYAIYRPDQTTVETMEIGVYDLTKPLGRLRLMQALLQLSRLFSSLARAITAAQEE